VADRFALWRCPDSFIRGAVEAHHYLHCWPDPRSLPFGYALLVDGQRTARDGRPFGALVFKKLQHHRQRGLFGYPGLPTGWQVLDLARVWVHPDLQAVCWQGTDRQGRPVEHRLCAFSRMVSLALRQVQRDWLLHHPPVFPHLPYHIELVISYCERAHHDGTGYRAAGFEKWPQLTADGTKEIYLRRLRPPRWRWTPTQLDLGAAA